MTTIDPIVEFSEPLALAGLDEQWKHGDHLALIEAIALCHKNGWSFPDWVSNQIGETMAEAFLTLFPDTSLDRASEAGNKKLEIPHDNGELADRHKKAGERVARRLGLKQQGTGVVEKSRKRRRDLELAFLIADRCRFDPNSRNSFIGVENAKTNLADAISNARDMRDWPSHISIECKDASEAVIDHAWKRYSGFVKATYAGLPADEPADAQEDALYE
jgi:hypothetical protein